MKPTETVVKLLRFKSHFPICKIILILKWRCQENLVIWFNDRDHQSKYVIGQRNLPDKNDIQTVLIWAVPSSGLYLIVISVIAKASKKEEF